MYDCAPIISAIASVIGAIVLSFGVCLAWRTLALDRFRTAANLMASHSHVSRYHGVLRLAELWKDKQHRRMVEKSFFAFLKHPPHFAGTESLTDYESIDTVEVVNFLNSRCRSARKRYPPLPSWAPFRLDEDHFVIANETHSSYNGWLQRTKGVDPEYAPRDKRD